MLPRSLNEIYENIRDFLVCSDNGTIVATSALHILWEDLAEIRSVAVSKKYQGLGIGKKLIRQGLTRLYSTIIIEVKHNCFRQSSGKYSWKLSLSCSQFSVVS